jgi:hypothetical protein
MVTMTLAPLACGLFSTARSEIALIEWPQRVGMDCMPRDRLDLHFELLDNEDGEPNPPKSFKRTEAVNNDRAEGNGDEDEDEDEDSEQRRVRFVLRSARP